MYNRITVSILALALCFIPHLINARIINIPDDFEAIQEGIDAAEDGDTVLVQPGEYVDNINFEGKEITVASLILTAGDEAYIDSTIIDGDANGSSVVVFRNNESETSILTGYTIRNGRTDYGGGVYIRQSSPTLMNLKVVDNEVTDNGGGIFCTNSRPNLNNILINNNSAQYGGGLSCYENSEATVENSEMSGNYASQDGGGVQSSRSQTRMYNIEIIDNVARDDGGGITVYHGAATLEKGVISGNESRDAGGAVYNSNSDFELIGVLISGNASQTGAIAFGSGVVCIEKSTIVDNIDCSGGIRAPGGGLSIFDSIVRGHDQYEVHEERGYVTYSNIEGGIEGEGNIDEDPLFVDAEDGNYHLELDSPCVDTGDPESPQDPDGTRADMGAFPFYQRGVLSGRILDASDDGPIENVIVFTTLGDSVLSDNEGNWFISPAKIGEFNLTAHVKGFIDTIVTEQSLEHEETLEYNFALLHPEFTLSRDEVIVELYQGDSALFDLEIENNGNGRLEYSVSKQIPGIEPWRLINRIELCDEESYSYYGVVLIDESRFYLSVHTPDGNKIYVINEDGELLDGFPQPGYSQYGLRDLAWDGELIWGTDGETVYAFDLTGDVDRSWDIQGDRYSSSITWDHKDEILWMARITGRSIIGYDREGNLMSSLDWNEGRLYGLAYHGDDPDGFGLYVQRYHREDNNSQIYKINTIDNDIMFVKTLYSDDDGRFEGGFISDSYFPNATAFFGIINTPDLDFLDIWFLDAYSGWMDIDPIEGVIEAGQTQDFELMIRTAAITPGEFNGNMIFQHNAIGEVDTLSVSVQNLTSVTKEVALAPYKFGITCIYPNPFNSVTRIAYSLQQLGYIKLVVYDLTGRKVDVIDQGFKLSGCYSMSYNALSLPSGVYLLNLTTTERSSVRKMLLIK